MKQFLMKQLIKSQLKKIPEDQRAVVEKIANENPELLMQLVTEVQEEMKSGKDQMAAFMAVAERHKDELQALVGKAKNG